MKKLLFVCICSAALAQTFSCNNNKKETTGTKENTEKSTTKPAGDLTGTYATTENNMPMEFTLNADGTGNENYHGDMRPITWLKKEGKVFFKYKDQPTEFELPIDTDKGEIHYGSLVYKKK
ncbi:MAG: hypothetical protein WBC06_10255 [Chitinophagaceae bacterium]